MKTHLDGPRLAAWLKSTGLITKDIAGEAAQRRVYAWSKETLGPVPYVGTVDKILVQLGLNESDIPDQVWCDTPACKGCGESLALADHPRIRRCKPCQAAYNRKLAKEKSRQKRQKRAEKQKRQEYWADRIDKAFQGLEKTGDDEWKRKVAA